MSTSGQSTNGGDGWRWPDHGAAPAEALEGQLDALHAPYRRNPPPFCYPGSSFAWDAEMRARVCRLIEENANLIGTHTHGDEREGGFEEFQKREAEAIYMLASVLGGDADAVDGYFCGGGTEANDEGLWIGRQWLRQHPDPANRGIAVLCTPPTHYSIHKGSAKLDVGQSQWATCSVCHRDHIFVPDPSGAGITLVGMNGRGEMHLRELERIFRLRYDEGFRRFLIVPTVGTTSLGSVDPVEEIGTFVHEQHRSTLAHCYVHVDASIGGFTVPFIEPERRFGFNVPEVMSIAVDGDKMGQLPYPAGIFLCRKDLQRLVARQAIYIRGHEDDTFSGSRSALAPMLAWYQFRRFGRNGQRAFVLRCLEARDRLLHLIAERLPWARPLAVARSVNILPVIFPIENGEIPEEIVKPVAGGGAGEVAVPSYRGALAPYELRADFFPNRSDDPRSCPAMVYKLSVWPHVIPFLERFVTDVARAREQWYHRDEAKR